MSENQGGIAFRQLDTENNRLPAFYVQADVMYHGDCVDDFNMMGQIPDAKGNVSLEYQLDVVAIGNYQVPPHEH
jgi:hypothetical protein